MDLDVRHCKRLDVIHSLIKAVKPAVTGEFCQFKAQ